MITSIAETDKFLDHRVRLHLVKSVIELGDEAAQKQFQLTYQELRQIQQEDWWTECAKEYYAGEAAGLDRKLTALIDKSMLELQDRVDNGDAQIDRLGDVQLVPIKARDLAGIAKDLMEKRQVLRGLPGSIVKAEINLNSLADKLRNIVPAERLAKAIVVDGAEPQGAA